MKRAEELFALEVQPSESSLVAETWQAQSAPEAAFISVAAAHWEIVVTRQRGIARLTVRGPETTATPMPIPDDAEFFGIRFTAGTYMPALPPGRLVDTSVPVPTWDRSFRLAGRDWEVPDHDTANAVVDGLADAGVLVHDPVVAEAVHGDVDGYSTRSLERRLVRATGLSRGTYRRIRRAQRAVELLAQGTPPSDVAHLVGYADQPHLTRSLRRLVGQTPGRIAGSSPGH